MCQKVHGMCHQRPIDVPIWHIQYKTIQRHYKDRRFLKIQNVLVDKVLKAHKRFTKNQKRFTKKVETFTTNGEGNIRHNKDNTKDRCFFIKKVMHLLIRPHHSRKDLLNVFCNEFPGCKGKSIHRIIKSLHTKAREL